MSERESRYAIDARGVEVTYGDGTEAVRGVDLRIPEGEFFGFLGANGAGKTTTIKTLVTLLSATGGEISINGYDVDESPRAVRQTVGYMAQETAIDTDLTARENIQFACEAYGVSGDARADRIDELLDLVELADVQDKTADGFSGGMKKRLDAATALVHEPPLVFLDEPTTGLDPKARNRLWDYFERINEQGTTLFLTTQYLEEADQLCDRLSLIRDGQIVATGSPDELKSQVGGQRLDIDIDAADPEPAVAVAREFFGTDATIEPTDDGLGVTAESARERGTDLLVALRDADIAVTGFNIRAPTLDDVFLAITDDDDSLDGGNAAEPTPAGATDAEGGR